MSVFKGMLVKPLFEVAGISTLPNIDGTTVGSKGVGLLPEVSGPSIEDIEVEQVREGALSTSTWSG